MSCRRCDICCTIGGHGRAWPDDVDEAGAGSGGCIGSVDSYAGECFGGCGVGTSKAEGCNLGHGGPDDDAEGVACEMMYTALAPQAVVVSATNAVL